MEQDQHSRRLIVLVSSQDRLLGFGVSDFAAESFAGCFLARGWSCLPLDRLPGPFLAGGSFPVRSSLEANSTLQSMDPAGVTATLVDDVSLITANRFQKSGIRLFWSSIGKKKLHAKKTETPPPHRIRLASRQLSRGVSSLLPPQPALHTSQSTRLDQLLSTLSPAKSLPSKLPSPVRAKAAYGEEAIPPSDSGLKSPHRFSPGPSRMSPHHARLPSSMASPNRPKRVQRSLMSPTHSKAIRNVLSPKRAKPMAVLQESARQVHVDGTGRRHEHQQALPAVAKWGPRPGSATFSSSSPGHTTRRAKEPDSAPTLAGMSLSVPLLHTSLAHQPHAPDAMLGQQQQQQELPVGVGPRPQSASYSSALVNDPLHQPTGVQPAASPTRHMLTGAALHETLPEAAQMLPPIIPAAHQEGLGDLPLAAAPDGDGLPARPASAFAPVAVDASPTEWQADAQATEAHLQAALEPVGGPLQLPLRYKVDCPLKQRSTCSTMLQPSWQPEAPSPRASILCSAEDARDEWRIIVNYGNRGPPSFRTARNCSHCG
ncbi:hypothetical protein WJX77_004615 [Trebouxia sp. C0004]